MALPKQVKIVEVGPRDGLQNEAKTLDVATKVSLINALSKTGLSVVEAGSFVSPRWVPQMANSDEVYTQLERLDTVNYPVLVPNEKGLDRALEVEVKDISCFTAASDAFTQKNINCTVDESLRRIESVITKAKQHNLNVRGYVSCIAGCPYQGDVAVEKVAYVTERLLAMGCDEISLGDTIGVGTPGIISSVLEYLLNTNSGTISSDKLALHLHDTYGQALANIFAGLQQGIAIFDSSVAGLGGCPYADGASGNVATEDLVYLLNGLGIKTGVDLEHLVDVGDSISKTLGRENQSKVAKAILAKRK